MLESAPGDVQDLRIPLDTAEPLRYRQVRATALANPEITVGAETQYNIISLCGDMNRAERDLLRISSRLSLIKMEIVPRRQRQCCSSHSLSVRDANVQSTISVLGWIQKKGPDLQSPLLVAMTGTHQVNPTH